MTRAGCALCGLLHDERDCRLPGLRALFVGSLTDHEERFLRWLASCDRDSVEVFKALVQRTAEAERERYLRERDRARSWSRRWKGLAARQHRESVPIGLVCHEVGNALPPVEYALDRIARIAESEHLERARIGVRRVLVFARALRAGDPSVRVWRRS
jgi:hypothetical protein